MGTAVADGSPATGEMSPDGSGGTNGGAGAGVPAARGGATGGDAGTDGGGVGVAPRCGVGWPCAKLEPTTIAMAR